MMKARRIQELSARWILEHYLIYGKMDSIDNLFLYFIHEKLREDMQSRETSNFFNATMIVDFTLESSYRKDR